MRFRIDSRINSIGFTFPAIAQTKKEENRVRLSIPDPFTILLDFHLRNHIERLSLARPTLSNRRPI